MAAIKAVPLASGAPADDDESWLYGDENKEQKDPKKSTEEEKEDGKKEEVKESPRKRRKEEGGSDKPEDKEEGEMSGEEESQAKDEDEDSDDDDDDNVQVTIGDIKQWTVNETPRNLFKSAGAYPKPSSGVTVVAPKTVASTTKSGTDVEAQGTVNGIPTYEFDLDSLSAEDKPWRNPGADITDYFNYGFNEETWQQYCEKQRRVRLENGVPLLGTKALTSHIHHSSSSGQPISRIGEKDSSQTGSSIPTTSSLRKAHPPPNRKVSGTIDVIGSTAHDSRRPGQGNVGSSIPVTGSTDYRKFAPTSIPPPGMPPMMMDYSIPPPGMPPPPGVPPPGVPPPPGIGVAITSYGSESYDPFSHPPPGFNFDNNSYSSNYSSGHTPNYPSYDDRYKYGSDRHRERSPDSEYGRDSHYRDRERDRDRDSHRDRDRGRDRERDRDRDRDRDRRRSRSADSHSRRRKHRDDEEDHHRSKHKKSRKRRDKDDEGGDSITDDGDKGD